MEDICEVFSSVQMRTLFGWLVCVFAPSRNITKVHLEGGKETHPPLTGNKKRKKMESGIVSPNVFGLCPEAVGGEIECPGMLQKEQQQKSD